MIRHYPICTTNYQLIAVLTPFLKFTRLADEIIPFYQHLLPKHLDSYEK